MSNRFDELCRERNLNVYRISQETGIPNMTLSAWSKGKTLTLKDKNAVILADYFGVSVDYLMGREDVKKETAQMDSLKAEVNNLFDALPVERQALAVEYLRFLRSRGNSET